MEPWDTLRNHLPEWAVTTRLLEDVMGYVDWDTRTIFIDSRLPRSQARSTLMHEVIHVMRGDTEHDEVSERTTSIEAARILVNIHALVAALAASLDIEDVMDLLVVDVGTLRTRVRNLDPDEVVLVRQSLTARVPANPGELGCAIARWWQRQEQPEPPPTFSGHPDTLRFGPIRLATPA